MTTRKQLIKQKIREKRYFYLEGDEFRGNYGTKRNPFVVFETKGKNWDIEERRAKALAKKIFNKKLAGGMFTELAVPSDLDDYIVVKVPKSIKPLRTSSQDKFVDNIISYENGQMNKKSTKKLFNKLRKTGIGKHLQGHYSSRM